MGDPCDIKTGAPKESQKGIRASRHPCRKDGTPLRGPVRRSDSATLKPATISLDPPPTSASESLPPSSAATAGRVSALTGRILGKKSRHAHHARPSLVLPRASCANYYCVMCCTVYTATHGGVIGTAGDYQ